MIQLANFLESVVDSFTPPVRLDSATADTLLSILEPQPRAIIETATAAGLQLSWLNAAEPSVYLVGVRHGDYFHGSDARATTAHMFDVLGTFFERLQQQGLLTNPMRIGVEWLESEDLQVSTGSVMWDRFASQASSGYLHGPQEHPVHIEGRANASLARIATATAESESDLQQLGLDLPFLDWEGPVVRHLNREERNRRAQVGYAAKYVQGVIMPHIAELLAQRPGKLFYVAGTLLTTMAEQFLNRDKTAYASLFMRWE